MIFFPSVHPITLLHISLHDLDPLRAPVTDWQIDCLRIKGFNTSTPCGSRLRSHLDNWHIKIPPSTTTPLAFLQGPRLYASTPSLGSVGCRPCPATFIIHEKTMRKPTTATEASKEPFGITREFIDNERRRLDEKDHGLDPFEELKNRFLNFKKQNYVENLVQYQNLAQGQAPKFMVIACADSRVCPSTILGFQPGEAFTVRNVANLVPPFQHGPSETNAALEFAVNFLEVANILVVGHSRCGGIRALMSMKDEADSSFIRDWVSVGKSARLSTKAAAGNLNFDEQCTHCEKESINGSLLNLLTYPWIERRLTEGTLSLHGGYYDFVNCTFEKWTLVYREGLEGGSKYAIKNCSLWS